MVRANGGLDSELIRACAGASAFMVEWRFSADEDKVFLEFSDSNHDSKKYN